MISPYDNYCVGYENPEVEEKGYVMGMVLSVGKVKQAFSHDGSEVLDGIIAFDQAEVGGTNIGQINMISVSSFCGPQGVLWGYDWARAEGLRDKVLGQVGSIYYYSIEALLEATERLFGTVTDKKFPIMPGSHVPCAERCITKKGPAELYVAVGVGIPEKREEDAVLVMEDAGEIKGISEKQILRNVAKSIMAVGENQKVRYKEMFVGFKRIIVGDDEIGSALVAMPYFAIARGAVPAMGLEALSHLTLREWERVVGEREDERMWSKMYLCFISDINMTQ